MNYGWLDPKFWVRRQSQRRSHFGDDDWLGVGSDLNKSSPRWRIVEKSKNGLQISKDKVGGLANFKRQGWWHDFVEVAWRKKCDGFLEAN